MNRKTAISQADVKRFAIIGAMEERVKLLARLDKLNRFIGDGHNMPAVANTDATTDAGVVEKKKTRKVMVMTPERRKALSDAMKAKWREGKLGKRKKRKSPVRVSPS